MLLFASILYHLLIIFFPSYNFFVVFIDISIILHKEPGGVLIFLPGQDDIEALQSLLEDGNISEYDKKVIR